MKIPAYNEKRNDANRHVDFYLRSRMLENDPNRKAELINNNVFCQCQKRSILSWLLCAGALTFWNQTFKMHA